jgi:hypothetical protein
VTRGNFATRDSVPLTAHSDTIINPTATATATLSSCHKAVDRLQTSELPSRDNCHHLLTSLSASVPRFGFDSGIDQEEVIEAQEEEQVGVEQIKQGHYHHQEQELHTKLQVPPLPTNKAAIRSRHLILPRHHRYQPQATVPFTLPRHIIVQSNPVVRVSPLTSTHGTCATRWSISILFCHCWSTLCSAFHVVR